MNEFCTILKMLRVENHLSQEAVAKKIGVSRTAYSVWENGHHIPCKEKCEKLCDLFNVDMNYLLGYSPIRNSHKNGVEIVIYNDKEKLEDSLYLPEGLLDNEMTYWAELSPTANSIAIYCRETKSLVGIFSKY